MWDPLDPTPQTDERQRQMVAVFFACVANKPADQIWEKMKGPFRHNLRDPFAVLRTTKNLKDLCEEHRLAPYAQVTARLSWLRDLHPVWTAGDLDGRHGYGHKTVNCIALYADRARTAALDVHVLRWLRKKGYPAPAAPPQSRVKYGRLKEMFLAEADALGKEAWELDREVWREGFLAHRKRSA